MWIRSQDGTVLTFGSTFMIKEIESKYHIIELKEVEGGISLGEYDTKERAIEVLDELEAERNSFDNFFVYQMPEK